jgi:5'-methylthioadenosine phosphorylase
MVIANLLRSVEMAKKILKMVATQIPEKRECQCATALKDAIITSPERIPAHLKKELALLIGKYVK